MAARAAAPFVLLALGMGAAAVVRVPDGPGGEAPWARVRRPPPGFGVDEPPGLRDAVRSELAELALKEAADPGISCRYADRVNRLFLGTLRDPDRLRAVRGVDAGGALDTAVEWVDEGSYPVEPASRWLRFAAGPGCARILRFRVEEFPEGESRRLRWDRLRAAYSRISWIPIPVRRLLHLSVPFPLVPIPVRPRVTLESCRIPPEVHRALVAVLLDLTTFRGPHPDERGYRPQGVYRPSGSVRLTGPSAAAASATAAFEADWRLRSEAAVVASVAAEGGAFHPCRLGSGEFAWIRGRLGEPAASDWMEARRAALRAALGVDAD